MSDKPNPTPPPPDAPAADAPTSPGAKELREFIVETVKDLLPGSKSAKVPADDQGPDVKAQMRAAIEDAKAEEKRTAAEQAREERIKALEDAKASKETPPVQFRKIEKFFGWRREDDDK